MTPVKGWNPLPGDAWAWWDGERYVALSVGTTAPDHSRELIEDWGPNPVPAPVAGWNRVPGRTDSWALFDSSGFPLIAKRSEQGWVFIHNAPIDLPLPWARRARRWLAAWLVCAFVCFIATIVTVLWAASGGSGTPLRQPCNAIDPRGVVAWIAAMVVSIAVASSAIPLFRWARPALVRSERRAWAILMSCSGVFPVIGLVALPVLFVLGGVGCGL